MCACVCVGVRAYVCVCVRSVSGAPHLCQPRKAIVTERDSQKATEKEREREQENKLQRDRA